MDIMEFPEGRMAALVGTIAPFGSQHFWELLFL